MRSEESKACTLKCILWILKANFVFLTLNDRISKQFIFSNATIIFFYPLFLCHKFMNIGIQCSRDKKIWLSVYPVLLKTGSLYYAIPGI